MNALLQSEFCARLCWTLAHSLWQVGAVAIVASIFAFALRRRSASTRYNVYLAGLLVSLAAFPVTFWLLRPASEAVAFAPSEPVPAAFAPAKPTATVALPEVTTTAPVLPAVEMMSRAPRAPQLAPAPPHLSQFVPWIAVTYLLGVCAMASRLALGMCSASRLSRRATPAAETLQTRLNQIARQWKLRIVPRLAVSAEVVVPKVVGIVRPVILLPLSAATGLAPDQLDMILAHELAHVRRHDLWVNLLQRIAETLLFFNPAIWYLSRRLTTLREDASDELVCSGAPSQATRYAAALVRVAELSRPRAAAEIAAVAATGRSPSELRRRVARLVGEPLREPVRLTRGGVAALAALVLFAIAAPFAWTTQAAEKPSDELSDSPKRFVRQLDNGTEVELVAIGTHQERPQEWWRADGGKLKSVPLSIRGGKVFPQEREIARELIFRVRNLPDGASYIRRIVSPGGDYSANGAVVRGEETPAEFEHVVFALPKEQQQFDLRLGVAAGEWKKVAENSFGKGQTTSTGDVQVVISQPLRDLQGTVIVVSHNLEDCNKRTIVFDKQGKEHHAAKIDYQRVGGVNQTTSSFLNLEVDQIERGEFQKRDYEWINFNDLPTQFDESKPAVDFSEVEAKSSPTNDSSVAKEESAATTNDMRELRSGAKVTLLGIGTNGESPARWWDGNGTPLEGVAYHLEGPRARPSEKAVAREVAFRVENVPDDAVIRMETKPIDGTPAEVVWRYGSLPGKYGGMVFFVPKDRQTFKLRVGVAGGDWHTLTTSQPTNAQATGILGDHGIVFSEAYAKGDDTVVIVSHNMENENTRVVAIDKAGSEFVGERAGRVSAIGGANQANWRFPNLLPESIEEFRFQTRLFLWAEFDELPGVADEGKEAVEFGEDNGSHELALQVVGPDGKPVPNVAIGIRSTPVLKNEQIRQGTFVRGDKWGATVKTDDNGRTMLLFFPKQPTYLGMSIKHPSFGPYFAEWSSEAGPQEIPHEFTFELEGAYSMGGVVVDGNGNPIGGVEIQPRLVSKRRPGDNEEVGSGIRAKTDAAGRWRIDSVPDSMNEVRFEISHPKYKPLRRALVREEFAIAEGEKPSKQIVLEQGLIVTGTVTDDAGKPIRGALVRTKFLNDIREAKTDEKGFYELIGCEPAMARIVVSAKGKAVDMQEVRVAEDMDLVDFQMKPGGKVRVRVVDENGDPIPKTRIFFQRWRGPIEYFEFDHVNQYADENGIWEWNEAPLDGFQADICPPGGMQLTYHPLIARDEEYVISPPQALVVSGTVIDAETKQPVKAFRVIPGTRESSTVWARRDIVQAADGKYQIRRTRGSAAGHLIRIEADGYRATVSRDIKNDEGNVTVNFELQRGKNVAAQVMTPAGEPAIGAKVALGVAKSQIRVENGEIDDGSTYAATLDTDEDGRFSFPPQETGFQLVITHPAGYAHIKGTPDNLPEAIQLTPWARVEGTFRVGKEPQPNVSLRLYSDKIQSFGEGAPNIFTDHQAMTGPGGRFVFPRVIPGEGRIGRDILLMVDDGAQEVTSAARIKGHFPEGETTTMDLGGDGQPVIGRLAPPDDFEDEVFWNFALIHVRGDPAPPLHPEMPIEVQALPEKRQAWWSEFLKTDEGKRAMPIYQAFDAQRSSMPFFTVTVGPDGTFRIDDMPEGDYSLSVRFSKFGPGKIQNLRFMVSPTGGEPFDLGVIKLER